MDDYVKSGMVVGLGTGSTAAFAGESVEAAYGLHLSVRRLS